MMECDQSDIDAVFATAADSNPQRMFGTHWQSAMTLNPLEILENDRPSLTHSHSASHLKQYLQDQQRNIRRQANVTGAGTISEGRQKKLKKRL